MQNTMTGVNEVQCSIAHVLLGSCCGLQGCRCSQLNATGFPFVIAHPWISYPHTQKRGPIEFYSAPASLAALIPEGDLVLTE